MIRGIHRVASVLAVALVAALMPIGSAAGAVSIAVAPPQATLRSVSMIDASTAVAVATNGTIWRTTSSGSDWSLKRVADAYDFRAVDFWNATKGVAVDLQGKVAQTANGGSTWADVDFTPNADMDGITAPKNHNGLACIPGTTEAAISVGGDPDIFDDSNIGPVAMRTWGNLKWWQTSFFQAQPYLQDDGNGNFEPVGEGEFLDVSFASGTHGWAVGRDTYEPGDHKPALYGTTNTGGSWTKLTLGYPSTLNAVAFASTTAGVVAGQLAADGAPRAYYTTNGGSTWSEGTLPSGIGIPRALHMTSATAGWLAGDGGTLLRTTDGGETWTACVKPDGFTANLYDVELVGTTGIAVGTSAVLLTTDGITWTGASAPATPADVVRIEGADRIATAIAAAKVAFPSGAGTVVIATARNWPDALGGAALAGAVDGPILLTEPTALPSTVAQAISDLGASKAIILGGTAAVSPAVASALATKLGGAGNVTRIDGADRYETARKVAAETVKRLGTFSGTAFIATGANFPD
ncbi:MAG: cell wall-binding repeat-containing protein, partial [Coriobacteriia bacterium]|nr:cell wall-binding repeat-containing protein [Coriobacteriia bacterium]